MKQIILAHLAFCVHHKMLLIRCIIPYAIEICCVFFKILLFNKLQFNVQLYKQIKFSIFCSISMGANTIKGATSGCGQCLKL